MRTTAYVLLSTIAMTSYGSTFDCSTHPLAPPVLPVPHRNSRTHPRSPRSHRNSVCVDCPELEICQPPIVRAAEHAKILERMCAAGGEGLDVIDVQMMRRLATMARGPDEAAAFAIAKEDRVAEANWDVTRTFGCIRALDR